MHRLVFAGLVVAIMAPPCCAEDKVTVEKVAYAGWKNNLRMSNGTIELIATLDVGPRIISLKLKGKKNVFKEYKGQMGKSGEKSWQIRGGHRVWTAPEDLTRTYALDNQPIKWKDLGNGTIRLIPPPDKPYGIQKELDVQMASKGSTVKITNRITNVGQKPTSLSVWALSVMAPGGMEVIPLAPYRPHPGPPEKAGSPEDYAPDQHMVMWSYFRFGDPRWSFGKKYILLKQDEKKGPTKIGLAHQRGWVGYLNQGTLFVKRFGYKKGKKYPDRGCNFETFTNEDMLEMELLSPLARLAPKRSIELTETWELYGNVPACRTASDVDKHILPRVEGKK